MKKMYKVIALVLCAVLLVAGSVMGTLAYLQMKTDPITNTMTVGNVSITLDEAKVDAYGVKDGNTRITAAPNQAGNKYKLIPGHTYVKDPTITVKADSEKCYIFVRVENEIAAILSGNATYKESDPEDTVYTIEAQIEKNGWIKLEGVDNVYYKSVEAVETDSSYPVFQNFTVKSELKYENLDDYAGKTIIITAYAVQADGFNSALAAWNATFGAPANT